MIVLPNLERAIRAGCEVRTFLSGGGLRVTRVEKRGVLRGYGEAPYANESLAHADEDYAAGGRPYAEVYGGAKPHYLTGESDPCDAFDAWILQGRSMRASLETKWIRVRVVLEGFCQSTAPEKLMTDAKRNGSAIWHDRGHRVTISWTDHFFANGSGGWSFDGSMDAGGRPWESFYSVTRTGDGDSIMSAIANALIASDVEVLP
jgi:hypothetical protein